jgi:hypothetical protein
VGVKVHQRKRDNTTSTYIKTVSTRETLRETAGQLNRNQQRTSKAFSQCGFIYAMLKYYAYFVTHLTVLHHQQPNQFKSKNMGTPTTNTQHLNYQDAQLRF